MVGIFFAADITSPSCCCCCFHRGRCSHCFHHLFRFSPSSCFEFSTLFLASFAGILLSASLFCHFLFLSFCLPPDCSHLSPRFPFAALQYNHFSLLVRVRVGRERREQWNATGPLRGGCCCWPGKSSIYLKITHHSRHSLLSYNQTLSYSRIALYPKFLKTHTTTSHFKRHLH